MQEWVTRLEQQLSKHLAPKATEAPDLYQAMHYAVMNGGKRLRPQLVYATGTCFGAELATLDAAACAVELVHCYSLVHDDLPAMDNDDFRRGKPSCHKAFDEATAILAGDALLTLSFDLLARANMAINAEQQLQLIRILAEASGPNGMIAGQMIDIASEGKTLATSAIETMHRLKTGALIKASVLMGAHIAGCDAETLTKLTEFADTLGLAFQIKDDILDVEGSFAEIGKTPGLDVVNRKASYLSEHSINQAKVAAQTLHQHACTTLNALPNSTTPLEQLSKKIVDRTH